MVRRFCTFFARHRKSFWHFWVALVALGLSWNFLFVGGTTLLTSTYLPEEKPRIQAANDFLIFVTMAAAALGAGVLHDTIGWYWLNVAALPAYVLCLLVVIWGGNPASKPG